MRTIYLLLILLFPASVFYGQEYDCANAVEIFDKSTLELGVLHDPSENNDDLKMEECPDISFVLDIEGQYPSYWLKWTVFESGTLTFDMTMDTELYDLDFIVYRADDSDPDCSTLTPIRCMFSGPNVTANGEIIPGDNCSPTGLSLDDEDLSETGGCPEGQNGYARYLDCEAGEVYYMVILNYFNADTEIAILDFCGTAKLGPEDELCIPTNVDETEIEKREISVAPNPVGDYLRIGNLSIDENTHSNWMIVDMYGATYNVRSDRRSEFVMDVRFLNSGIYVLIYEEGGILRSLKFVKS